jgi:hypothetical protein
MTKYVAPKHPTVEFSTLEAEELKTLRAYVEKLGVLKTTITGEFQGEETRQALLKIQNEISNTAEKIVELEIRKIQAELKFKVK